MVSSFCFTLVWPAMIVSKTLDPTQASDLHVRRQLERQVREIKPIARLVGPVADEETSFRADPAPQAARCQIPSDQSTWQVLNIVHLGGIGGIKNFLSGQLGPIYPFVIPAHENDGILVRPEGGASIRLLPLAGNQRNANREHSFFIRLVPLILAAFALFFAGSSLSRKSSACGPVLSGSQITILASSPSTQADFASPTATSPPRSRFNLPPLVRLQL